MTETQNPVVDKYGIRRWFDEEGKLHREDGPAVIFCGFVKEWYLHGKLHREDGPAVIYADGTVEYWLNGEEDAPF